MYVRSYLQGSENGRVVTIATTLQPIPEDNSTLTYTLPITIVFSHLIDELCKNIKYKNIHFL